MQPQAIQSKSSCFFVGIFIQMQVRRIKDLVRILRYIQSVPHPLYLQSVLVPTLSKCSVPTLSKCSIPFSLKVWDHLFFQSVIEINSLYFQSVVSSKCCILYAFKVFYIAIASRPISSLKVLYSLYMILNKKLC